MSDNGLHSIGFYYEKSAPLLIKEQTREES